MLTIGKLSEECGITADTIRFYEKRGLMRPSSRTAAGYRLYDLSARERLALISRAKSAGFSLNDIGHLLTLRDNPEATCTTVYTHAVEKLAELESKISELEIMRKTLASLIDRCGGQGPIARCPILDSFDGKET